jgi:hypothetical protein
MTIRKKVAQSQGTHAQSTRCKHTALKWTRRTVDTHIPHQDKRPPNTHDVACIQCKCTRAARCRLQAQPTAHCPTRLRNATATYILPNPATVNLKMPRCEEHDVEATGIRKAHDMEAQIMKSKNIRNSSAKVGG